MEFVGKLKNLDYEIVANESMFALTILEKKQGNEIKIFSRKCNSITYNGKLSRNKGETNKYTIKQV